MGKITRLVYSRKVQVKPYEPAEVTVEAQVDADESPAEVYKTIRKFALRALAAESAAVARALNGGPGE